jgi:hypothetical protein
MHTCERIGHDSKLPEHTCDSAGDDFIAPRHTCEWSQLYCELHGHV